MGLQKYRADIQGDTQSNGAVPYFTKWIGGPSLALIRKCPLEGSNLPPRTVYVTGEAESWFTIPGACRYRGKIIRGNISVNRAGEYQFSPYQKDKG